MFSAIIIAHWLLRGFILIGFVTCYRRQFIPRGKVRALRQNLCLYDGNSRGWADCWHLHRLVNRPLLDQIRAKQLGLDLHCDRLIWSPYSLLLSLPFLIPFMHKFLNLLLAWLSFRICCLVWNQAQGGVKNWGLVLRAAVVHILVVLLERYFWLLSRSFAVCGFSIKLINFLVGSEFLCTMLVQI